MGQTGLGDTISFHVLFCHAPCMMSCGLQVTEISKKWKKINNDGFCFLQEMFVRPIAKGQQAFNKHVGLLRPFINYVSPTECNFLFKYSCNLWPCLNYPEWRNQFCLRVLASQARYFSLFLSFSRFGRKAFTSNLWEECMHSFVGGKCSQPQMFSEKALRKHRIDDMTNSALQEQHGSLDLKVATKNDLLYLL